MAKNIVFIIYKAWFFLFGYISSLTLNFQETSKFYTYEYCKRSLRKLTHLIQNLSIFNIVHETHLSKANDWNLKVTCPIYQMGIEIKYSIIRIHMQYIFEGESVSERESIIVSIQFVVERILYIDWESIILYFDAISTRFFEMYCVICRRLRSIQ